MAAPIARAYGIPLYQPDQGLVVNVPAMMIPDRACSECDNVVFFDGKIVVRPGFQVDSVLNPITPNPTAAVTHLGTMATQAEVTYLLRVEVQGTVARAFAFDTTSGLWSEITGSPIFAAANGQRPASCQFKGEWLLTIGASNLQRWIGTGALVDVSAAQTNAALKAPYNPYFVCSTASRVFLANAVDPATNNRIPWRVWYSDTLNSGIWSNGAGLPEQGSSGYQDLLHESSAITGMIFHGGTRVVVFKRHSIYRASYVGSPVWYDFLPISKSRGMIASQSLQEWNDNLIWLGDDFNVYMMSVSNQIQAVADSIHPILRELVNPYFAFAITSGVDHTRGLYWLKIPYDQNGATVNKLFTMNLNTGAWSMGTLASTAFQMSSALWYRPDPPFLLTKPILIWGATDGQVYHQDYATPLMIDRDVKFYANWWGKVQDLLALQQQRGMAYKEHVGGETSDFSKAALAGLTGVAQPQIRMGSSLKDVAMGRNLYQFYGHDADDPTSRAYVANRRVDAARFGQFGIHWPLGISNPAEIQGFTAWGLPRGVAR